MSNDNPRPETAEVQAEAETAALIEIRLLDKIETIRVKASTG